MERSDRQNQQILHGTDKELAPKPAELVTLPSHRNIHDHDYTQIVIGLKGQTKFDISASTALLGPAKDVWLSRGASTLLAA